MARLWLLAVAGVLALTLSGLMLNRTQAGAPDIPYIFGGSHSQHGPALAVVLSDYSEIAYLEILDIPVASPPCDKPFFNIRIDSIPLNNYEFDLTNAAGTIHGNIYALQDGRLRIDGTITLLPPCEATLTFQAFTGAVLQGDFNCSVGGSSAQTAGVGAQSHPPGTEEAITVADVFPLFDYFIFGPAVTASPSPPAGTPIPGDPGPCTVPGAVSSTGVVSGDFDCDQQLTFEDILYQLRYIGLLALEEPVPAPDCVPIGHYYNVSQ